MALEAYTQDELLELVRRTMGATWFAAVQEAQDGYELLLAAAKIGERLSQAAKRGYDCSFARTAPVGAKATVTLSATRVAKPTTVTLLPDTRLVIDGMPFATTTKVTFGVDDAGPYEVQAEAVVERYEWNFSGPFTAASGLEVTPSELDITLLRTDPPYGDPSIEFELVSDATGGELAALALHAEDRALHAVPGETPEALRARMTRYQTSGSPTAVADALHAILDPLGVSFRIIETFDDGYRGCYDAPDPSASDTPPSGIMIWDDERTVGDMVTDSPWWGRWLDAREVCAAAIVLVPNIDVVSEMGFVLDDPMLVITDVNSAIGERGAGALDWDGAMSDDLTCGALDGEDSGKQAVYGAIWSTLQRSKPFGISVALELWE